MNLIHQWTVLHKTFISTFIEKLEHLHIRYFILRNYEELPDSNSGKDVDIVIAPGCYKKVSESLKETMKELDIHYYQVTQFDKMRCWYIMDFDKKFGIHIDIIENEVYKGFTFFNFDDLYKKTTKYKDFVVLQKSMDTVMLLVQNLVAYKSLKTKYQHTISLNYSSYKKEIDQEIISFWGKKVGNSLIEKLQSNDFDAIVSNAKKIEKEALKQIFFKRPFETIKGIIRFLCGKFYRVIWCPKKYWRFFAVEAPDGTGKTTFINNLILELRKYYVSDEVRFCVHHFRPRLLPNLGAAGEKAGIQKQDKDFDNPHRAKPAGFISSLIRMTYYWLDYVIGVPYLIRKEVQYERFSIYDRYIYDFIVDPYRSRINLPNWIRKLYAHLVLQPQIVFVLHADADVIYERKKELTKEEIARQLEVFKKIDSINPNVVFIDANKTVEEMVNSATKIILDKFLTRI